MDLELDGKTAIVTGGSRGIGKAIALVLAAEGVDLALVARDQAALDAAARDVATASGRRVVGVVCDTGDTASVDRMVAQVVTELGSVDILVNCAARPGGGPAPRADEVPDDLFHEEMNVKVLGYLRCARAVAPHMKARGWGRIINVSGLAARVSGNAVGSMRNVAVAALTKNLADELGPYGINVTVVHPGMTWTERVPGMLQAIAERQGISLEEAEVRLLRQNSLQRTIDATDIANVVAFLASPKSVAITGDAIAAGGGAGRSIYY